jgi:hypothetical protein
LVNCDTTGISSLMCRSSGEKDGSHGPTLSQILFSDGTRVTS